MKSLRSNPTLRAVVALALWPSLVGLPLSSWANPAGEIVVNGSFQFERAGDTLRIMQSSDKGIIHWDSFSIPSGSTTQFLQPGASAAVLNRVTGSARSDIMGQLLANGQVWVINPNGVLVGPGANIDVGGLVLSTLDIANENFLNGGDLRFSGNSTATIANSGTIKAAQGDVHVFAQRVENNGLIGALDGRVVLAADNEILVQQGSGNVFLSGNVGHGHILNNGEVVGVDVALKARNNNMFGIAVQNNGIARAQTAEKAGGRVLLVAQGGAGVVNTGTVDASGTSGGQVEISSEGAVQLGGVARAEGSAGAGGGIRVTGTNIDAAAGTTLSARGSAGGGEIVVGNRVLGNGAVTQRVNLGAASRVDAGSDTGNGGSVAVSAAGDVRADGLVSAASGSGLGGTVSMTGGAVTVGATGAVEVDGATGGLARLDADGDLTVEGAVVGRGSVGRGGVVALTGEEVTVANGATADVSGNTRGGILFVGGGFGGRDAGLRNADRTTVATGATLRAEGLNGDGGMMSMWADGDMDFRGAASVAGSGRGGFVEVSGKETLTFAGSVDLSGDSGANGTLLLDPQNVRIAHVKGDTGLIGEVAGQERGLGVGSIDAVALMAAWETGNVVIHTGGIGPVGADDGDIVIESDVQIVGSTTNANSLSFFAHRDIIVAPNENGATVTLPDGSSATLGSDEGPTHIMNRGSGNINLVAGWDGTGANRFLSGGLPTINTVAQGIQDDGAGGGLDIGVIGAARILSGEFGEFGTQGRIDLNPNAAFQVKIGSAAGETNLFTNDLYMTPGNVTGEFVQIGWQHDGTDAGGLSGVSGNINVHARGNLIATNSILSQDWRYIQIGHGGRMNPAAPGPAGVNNRVVTGDIVVNVGGVLFAQSGGRSVGTFQIGHGGRADNAVDVVMNSYGNIDVSAASMVFQVTAGATVGDAQQDNWIQIGHGGRSIRGEHAGNISLNARTGGINAFGTRVTQNAEGTNARSYFQVGHGGFNSDHPDALPWDFTLNLAGLPANNGRVLVGDEITTVAELRDSAAADGGDAAAAARLLRRTGTDANGKGIYGVRSTGKIGHAGDINVTAAQGVYIEAGGRQQAHAQIGHGGNLTAGEHGSWDWDNDGSADGDINVVATNGSVTMTRQIVDFNNTGTIVGGFGTQAFAQIGHGGFFSSGGFNGDITVTAGTGNVSIYGGQNDAHAMIGHGGRGNPDSGTGGNFVRGRRERDPSFAQGDILGNINVTAARDVVVRAGFRGSNSFAMIGHGGRLVYATDNFIDGNDMDGDGTADTFGAFVGDISVSAGGKVDGYAGQKNPNHVDGADPFLPGQSAGLYGMAGRENWIQIGHGGITSRADGVGDISVSAQDGNIRFEAVGGWDARANDGSYGNNNDNSQRGVNSHAMIGHGGQDSEHSALQENPLDGGNNVEGIRTNSVETYTMFDFDGNLATTNDRVPVLLSRLSHTQLSTGIIVHHDGVNDPHQNQDNSGNFTDSRFSGLASVSGTDGGGINYGIPTTRLNPDFSTVNTEMPEFLNTLNIPVMFSRGWSGDISLQASGDLLIVGAQRAHRVGGLGLPNPNGSGNIFTGGTPYQANSILPRGDVDNSLTHLTDSAINSFAMVGHGGLNSQIQGFSPDAGMVGDIDVNVGGSVSLIASDFARSIASGQSITIQTVGAGPVTFNNVNSTDPGNNWSMIGHGGNESLTSGRAFGHISVVSGGDVTLQSGRGFRDWAMIGHGGRDGNNFALNRNVAITGDILVDAGGGIRINGGSRDRAFAMIGHGGVDFEDADFTPVGSLLFLDNADNNTQQPEIRTLTDRVWGTSLVGTAGWTPAVGSTPGIGADAAAWSTFIATTPFQRGTLGVAVSTEQMVNTSFEHLLVSGDIAVTSRGTHALTGEGLTILGGQNTTATTLTGAGDPVGEHVRFGQIGHGGFNVDARITGDIAVDVLGGDARLKGGIFIGDSARIGHGGRDFNSSNIGTGIAGGSSFVGNIRVDLGAGFDLKLFGGDAPLYDDDGDGLVPGALFYNPLQTDFLIAPSDPQVAALETQLGLAPGTLTGLADANAVNTAVVRALGRRADALAGRPIQLDGDPALDPATVVGEFYPTAQLYDRQAAMAQIGHGGSVLGNTATRNIEAWGGNISVNTVTRGRDVILNGGDGMDNFALIGHGGQEVIAPITVTGDVTVNATRDIVLKGGDFFANSGVIATAQTDANQGNFAHIGHSFSAAGGSGRLEASSGTILVQTGRDLTLQGGGGEYAHAQIGHGAQNSRRNAGVPLGGHTGDVTVVVGRDVKMTAAEIREADAMNDAAFGGRLPWNSSLDQTALQGLYSFAQIGHGGARVSPVPPGLQGNITLRVGSNLVAGSDAYVLGSSTVPDSLAGNSSRGSAAYVKVGHGDYIVLPDGSNQSGSGFRFGDISVAVGQDLWSSGAQFGHVDPITGSSAITLSGATTIAVSRNNPTFRGTGRLVADRSVSRYETVQGDGTDRFGGPNQTILATSFSSGLDGPVRFYMPDREFGRSNGAANGATAGVRDSNEMQGLYTAQNDGFGNILAATYGTRINGFGYDDPEDDNPAGNTAGSPYATLRGTTPALSGTGGDGLGDEAIATEFGFTRDAFGLPVGTFTPQGTVQGHGFGNGYTIFYATPTFVPPVVPPVPPPPGPGPIPPPIIPPFVPPISGTESQLLVNSSQIDRFERPEEQVSSSPFTFAGWADGWNGGEFFGINRENGLSSVSLPEDYGGLADGAASVFEVFGLQSLSDWEAGALQYDPSAGLIPASAAGVAPGAGSAMGVDPFQMGPATTDDEEERRRTQGGAGEAPAMEDPFGAPPAAPATPPAMEDPFGAPAAPPAPAMEDPFGAPPAMGGAPATPAAPTTPPAADPFGS